MWHTLAEWLMISVGVGSLLLAFIGWLIALWLKVRVNRDKR